jgi:hypothetical protein
VQLSRGEFYLVKKTWGVINLIVTLLNFFQRTATNLKEPGRLIVDGLRRASTSSDVRQLNKVESENFQNLGLRGLGSTEEPRVGFQTIKLCT